MRCGSTCISTLLSDKTSAELIDTGVRDIDELRVAVTASGTLTLFAGYTGLERVTGAGSGTNAISAATSVLSWP